MKAQEFRAFVEQLGDLSPVQRDAIVDALSAKGSGEEVIALIETRFAAAPTCGHCGKADFKPWGSASDLKRYMCKACERSFNALTGTPLAGLRLREKWLDYARALIDGVSLRKAAARTDIHLETAFRWRHRFLATARDKKADAVARAPRTSLETPQPMVSVRDRAAYCRSIGRKDKQTGRRCKYRHRQREGQIPIETAARSSSISRNFVPWRFPDAGNCAWPVSPCRRPRNLHITFRPAYRRWPSL